MKGYEWIIGIIVGAFWVGLRSAWKHEKRY